MKTIISLIALVLVAPSPAAAQQGTASLSIRPDEVVVTRIEGEGFIVLSRGTEREPGSQAAPATVRFAFVEMPGMGMMLLVENGYDRAFTYRARMVQGRRSARTSTCTTLPGLMTIENWRHQIDRLELSEPLLSDTVEMSCR